MSAKHKKKTKSIKPVSERYTLSNTVVNCFLVIAFAVFPFFVNLTLNSTFPFLHFDDGFFQIRHQKYYFFLVISAALVIAEVMLIATKTSAEKKQPNPDIQYFLRSVTFTDWAVIAFVLVCAVSTVFSAHINIAVTGEELGHGRNNGMILYLCYAAIYFFIRRHYRYKEYVFTALAAVNGMIFLIALLNGFHIDPLNMFAQFKGTDENVYNNFITTIGNKNMFSSHICVTLPVMMTMLLYSDRLWRKAVYLAATLLGGMAIVVCDSDSVVLGMGVFIAVFLVLYCRKPKMLGGFSLAMAVMLGGVKLVNLFAILSGGSYKELSAIPFKLMQSNVTYAMIAFFAALAAVMLLLDRKKPGIQFHAAVQITLGALFALAAVAGVGIIVYFSVFNTQQNLGDLERTLRFSDRWGTHRGFMWNKSMEAFGSFNLFEKLFGKGPENFYYVFSPYFGELYKRFGDTSTDAAHNEYINYLINVGILGLLSYLTFTLSALFRGIRASAKQPVALVFVSAVTAYMAQAVVNIALPIATPLFIIFVALCEAMARDSEKLKRYEKEPSQKQKSKGSRLFYVASILMTIGGLFSIILSVINLIRLSDTSSIFFSYQTKSRMQLGAFLGLAASALQMFAGIFGVRNGENTEKAGQCLYLGISVAILSIVSNMLSVGWLAVLIVSVAPVLYIIGAIINKRNNE